MFSSPQTLRFSTVGEDSSRTWALESELQEVNLAGALAGRFHSETILRLEVDCEETAPLRGCCVSLK